MAETQGSVSPEAVRAMEEWDRVSGDTILILLKVCFIQQQGGPNGRGKKKRRRESRLVAYALHSSVYVRISHTRPASFCSSAAP